VWLRLQDVLVIVETGGSNNRSSDGNNNSSTPETTDGNNNSSTPETTDGNNSATPEAVTRQFCEALINENYETANELLHPGSPYYPLDESGSVSVDELISVEKVTYDEANERLGLEPEQALDQEVQDMTGTSEYTLVIAKFPDRETLIPVVESGGELQTVLFK